MSNTADVTPYENDQEITSSATAVEPKRSSSTPTDAEQAAIARHEEMTRQGRLVTARVSLRRSSPLSLLNAAQALGFAPVSSVDLPRCDFSERIEMQNAKGERIALQQVANTVGFSSTGGPDLTHNIVRRSTFDDAHRHLEAFGGGRVTVRQMANGEVELKATEPAKGQRDGTAVVTARIDAAGVARLDIENIRGGRCEEVLAGFAKAVGGTVKNKKLKPAYYQKPNGPGEPTRVKAKE